MRITLAIKEELLDEVKALSGTKTILVKYLSMDTTSGNTVRNMTKDGRLHPVRIGRRSLRFRLEDVELLARIEHATKK